jgi:hypothetical protein
MPSSDKPVATAPSRPVVAENNFAFADKSVALTHSLFGKGPDPYAVAMRLGLMDMKTKLPEIKNA